MQHVDPKRANVFGDARSDHGGDGLRPRLLAAGDGDVVAAVGEVPGDDPADTTASADDNSAGHVSLPAHSGRAGIAVPRTHRAAILAEAGEAFAERGSGGATLREIACRAGVTHGLIRQQFESKESDAGTKHPGIPFRAATRRPHGNLFTKLAVENRVQIALLVRGAEE